MSSEILFDMIWHTNTPCLCRVVQLSLLFSQLANKTIPALSLKIKIFLSDVSSHARDMLSSHRSHLPWSSCP